MKKFLKLLIGLFMLPLCWAFSRAFFFLLQALPAVPAGPSAWALPAGFAVSVLGFFILPRPFLTYVLAHELTHAVWGMLMGAKVGRMKVGKEGGHVMLSKSNFIISLAPYFFPFYTGLAIAFWFAGNWIWELGGYESWFLAVVGLTWGFHVTFTVYMLSQHQPDIQENGRLFSYAVIYLANLFFVILWMVAVGTPTFRSAWGVLFPETVSAYGQVWLVALRVWAWLKPLLPMTSA